MNGKNSLLKEYEIQNHIYLIRDVQVMIDRDLAELYQVPVKRLNEQVKRNIERFPLQFRFQLTDLEKKELVANCDRFESLKHSTTNPYAFTEQGISMLSAVLRSETAIKVSIAIMNAFVEMRNFLTTNASVFSRLHNIEIKQMKADKNFEKLFRALENKQHLPKQGVFFDGQIFDAYKFVSDIIRSAKKNILIIDNYIDESVITLLTKKKKNVQCVLFTKNISKQLKLDADRFNKQYGKLTLQFFDKSHDRFLIIDNEIIYHIGASLKDLGKKWFAFSKMNKDSVNILNVLDQTFN